MASVVVASIVTWERPMGEVVPKVEGVVVPLTAPDNSLNAEAAILCRGARLSKAVLLEETSICKKISELVLKL